MGPRPDLVRSGLKLPHPELTFAQTRLQTPVGAVLAAAVGSNAAPPRASPGDDCDDSQRESSCCWKHGWPTGTDDGRRSTEFVRLALRVPFSLSASANTADQVPNFWILPSASQSMSGAMRRAM